MDSREKKGKYTRLAGRHANYNIGTNAAHRWVMHMENAIDEHEGLKQKDECKKLMKNYFTYTAHYIVAAMTYMRSDQVRTVLGEPIEMYIYYNRNVSPF